MASFSITKLYGLLSEKMGNETAEHITSYIDQKMNTMEQEYFENFATKTDLANTKTDMIKWMFVFWIGQVLAIAGLFFALK